MGRRALRIVALAVCALAFGSLPASAADSYAAALSHELMSPFCPGRTLADCPSGDAQTLRMWIQVQEAAGRSRTEVENELVERYGEAMLGAPRARGAGLAAYLLPLAAFLLGGAGLAVFLRRQTRLPPAAAAPSTPLPSELARRVDEELLR